MRLSTNCVLPVCRQVAAVGRVPGRGFCSSTVSLLAVIRSPAIPLLRYAPGWPFPKAERHGHGASLSAEEARSTSAAPLGVQHAIFRRGVCGLTIDDVGTCARSRLDAVSRAAWARRQRREGCAG